MHESLENFGGLSGGEMILQVLEQYGVEALFTSPIAALAPLWEAIAKRDLARPGSIPAYYNCRHEVVAVSLAIGYYKATGKIAAVCLPTGLGVANGSMAMRTARQENIPMLILSPDTLTFGEDANNDPGPEWATFLIDDHGPAAHSALTTKWKIACRTNLDLVPNLHRALYFATQCPRGPVCVEIPFDVMMATNFETVPNSRFPLAIKSDTLQASDAHIAEIAELIGGAQSPIIITEHFGCNPKAIKTLTLFAEKIGAPVFEWWMPSFQNIARSHPLHAIAPVESVLETADVIVVLCSHGPWHSPASPLRAGARVVVIDEDPLRPKSAFWGYSTTDCVSGDPVANLSRILSQLHVADSAAVSQRVAHWTARNSQDKAKFESVAQVDADKAKAAGRVHASVFFSELSNALPSGSIVVDEMVAQVPLFTHFLFRDPTKSFVHLRGWQGGLGTGLGIALGAKVSNRDKTVVCVVGDGAFQYNPVPAALGFAQQYNCPILIAIMNNAGYVSQTWNFHRYFPTGSALTSQNTLGNVISPTPKYALLAQVWGGLGLEVSDEASLKTALKQSAGPGLLSQVLLLDVSVSP